MPTSDAFRPGARPALRHSLSWRLTLTILAIGMIAMLTFGWAAYRQVEMTLVRAGGDRAQTVATQIASLLEQSLQQNREDTRRIASESDLREFVEHPDDSRLRDAARTTLSAGAVVGISRVEIWSDAGARLLDLARTAPRIESAEKLPPAERPAKPGLSPLIAAGDTPFLELVKTLTMALPISRAASVSSSFARR